MILSDNGYQTTLTFDEAQRLERAGVAERCKCPRVCGEPGKTLHFAPGKTVSDLRFALNEMRRTDV